MNRLHTAAAKSRSARFSLYTPCTRSYTDTHKSDIHEIIFFEASVGGRMMEWNTLYMLLCLCKAFVFITHLPALHTFLIYQFQFLSPCHSRKAEDIFGCCHSSPREPESSLLFLFRLPKKHSLVTPLLKTKDASGINNIESIFFFFETSLLDFSTWFHPVIEASGFFFLGKIFFLFLKHQSSLKKQQVLSQETDNNNFLYIWRTGFLYFFSSYFTIPSQLYFLEPEPLWLCLCQFLL